MSSVTIRVAHLRFTARFEEAAAPRTCTAFRALMPFSQQLIQTRWSGEAAWVPMGDLDLGLPPENATSHPSRGDILLYPRGASETELIFAYGSCSFSSKVGQLVGNQPEVRAVEVGRIEHEEFRQPFAALKRVVTAPAHIEKRVLTLILPPSDDVVVAECRVNIDAFV